MLDKFIELLEKEVENHSIYVWGGNGESSPTVCEEWIRKKETSADNANRAIKTFHRAVKAGCEDKLRAFDCSGLGYYCLKELGLQNTDLTANALKSKCTLISKGAVKKGCFVFKVYNTGSNKGTAYHIGYVVDDALNVIEAQGRDEGVVKRALSKGGWNAYGLPSYFADEIDKGDEPANDEYIFTRILKNTSPRMKGEDVRELQKLLIEKGYFCGSCGADGSFGDDSEEAVKEFQQKSGLTVDGKAGKDTVSKLGGLWNENSADKSDGSAEVSDNAQTDKVIFTRILKKKILLMRGQDVKVLQEALSERGYRLGAVDAAYGSKTQQAVKEFQKASGLTADGITGKNTVTKLGFAWNGKN